MVKSIAQALKNSILFYFFLVLAAVTIAVFVLSLTGFSEDSLLNNVISYLVKIVLYIWVGGVGLGAIFSLAISISIPKEILRYFRYRNLEKEFVWVIVTTLNLCIFFLSPIGDFMDGDLLWRIIGSLTVPIIIFRPASLVSVLKQLL